MNNANHNRSDGCKHYVARADEKLTAFLELQAADGSERRPKVSDSLKHWEIIADNLSKAGWSWGRVSAIDSQGRTIWIADAHRGDQNPKAFPCFELAKPNRIGYKEPMKTVIPCTDYIYRPLGRCDVLFVLLLISCFAISPMTEAVMPPPDGGYFGANTAEGGAGALFSLTTGTNNTAIGSQALYSLSTGVQNTALGAQALKNNTADRNTAIGFNALVFNTTGENNMATGWKALFRNTTGSYNTANGLLALFYNTTGGNNTATGADALLSNKTGHDNTATGAGALFYNTTASDNTATGLNALQHNTSGDDNTAHGIEALFSNTAGERNTANGAFALTNNTTGSNNTALGRLAGSNVTTAHNVIAIGSLGANVSNSCFIGNITGVSEGGTISAVYINTDGQLGTQPPASSRRYKKEIRRMDKASEAILALKPVTFHYKSDQAGTPQFGLIAEEVAEVNPDLVVRDEKGEIYTVRYEAVNAMLLNEFLKEHRKNEEQQGTIGQLKSNAAKQEATISELKKDMGVFTTQLEEQAVQIQKVSAQLEANKPAPQVVNNP